MASRRRFLGGLLAAGLAPVPSWADAGDPAYVAAAKEASGSYALFGLTERGQTVFRIGLPGRGHAAAAHPTRPEAVAFARRPGTFALVIDCAKGRVTETLEAPAGRHFYGHGFFSADGAVLYTAENDYEAARGVIGLWDVAAGYVRAGEFASAGVGPHDIHLMPGGTGLVVANGGIETHPDSGRVKLNIATMRPNIAYLGLGGQVEEVVELDSALHRNSIRHIALRADGLVAFAMQWEGEVSDHPPLIGLHRRGGTPLLAEAEAEEHRRMQAYAASIAFAGDGETVAITSPRGSLAQVFDAGSGAPAGQVEAADVSGVATAAGGYVLTGGDGVVTGVGPDGVAWRQSAPVAFDNHLVRIGAAGVPGPIL